MASDKEIIEALGGPAKVAELLNYEKSGGVQRVHNWMSRGIPAQVKIDHPGIFLKEIIAGATAAPTTADQRTDRETPHVMPERRKVA